MLGETNGSRVERRRQAARAEILAAAWDLAEERGIAGFTLRDLAERVGMRAPSLYGYFAGKTEIYDALFARGYDDLTAWMAGVTGDPNDVAGSLAAGTRRFLEFCQARPARYQLLFSRAVPSYTPSQEAYAASIRSMAATVAALATLGLTDPAEVDLWLAVTAGLAAQQLANEPSGDRWVGLADAAAQMFVRHHHDRAGTSRRPEHVGGAS
jgi:AcrR family transcriptional regulator